MKTNTRPRQSKFFKMVFPAPDADVCELIRGVWTFQMKNIHCRVPQKPPLSVLYAKLRVDAEGNIHGHGKLHDQGRTYALEISGKCVVHIFMLFAFKKSWGLLNMVASPHGTDPRYNGSIESEGRGSVARVNPHQIYGLEISGYKNW
jgi:hypothetical protein